MPSRLPGCRASPNFGIQGPRNEFDLPYAAQLIRWVDERGRFGAVVLADGCRCRDKVNDYNLQQHFSVDHLDQRGYGDVQGYGFSHSRSGQVSFCQSGSQECFGLAYTSRIGTLSSGIATYTQRVTVGTECLLAKYWGETAGTTTYSPSQSASSLCKTVNKQNTSTVLSAERAQSAVGQTLNLSALVTCYSCTYQYGSAARGDVPRSVERMS